MKFSQRVAVEKPGGIQLAPMIDIVFLLLIFFIVTWNFARFETELDISVPAADEGSDPKRLLGEIVINIHRDGRMVVHSQEMSDDELFTKLRKVAEVRKNQSVILRIDEKAPSKHVIHALDICHRAKVYNVAFATKPSSS
ncbi:MAG: biopolymer transporter ExbD [Verrucomicrobiota bacterium]